VSERIERLRESLEEPLLVSAPANVLYLTGFSSSNAAVLVEPDRVVLFSDFRYAEAARAVEGAEFVQAARDLYTFLAEQLSGRVGFEAEVITYRQHASLHAGGIELVPRYGLVEALRAVKDEDEIALIRRAAEITSQALERFAEEQFAGRTERDLAWRLDELYHELRGDGPSFESIVAAGPNGARPHSRPTDRKIEAGETVVVDSAARVGAYKADCTRTFATGPLPDRLQEAYDVCLRAQLAALDSIRPGISGIDADLSAREVIEEAGLGDHFGHGLGHGLGLEVHEAPRLARESRDTLAERHVVTVEPGIYLEGLGGIRIEDLVVVREGEPEILTSFTKELVTVT
jgi:Xaa-Pro aminopeptidase